MQKIRESERWRVSTEEEAIGLINDYKQAQNEKGYTVTKSSYALHTKKSKGEVIDLWYIVDIEKNYEV